jgi:predicted HTH domain antitoxin
LAIWLYSQKRLTIGKAAQISGMSRFDFENLLAESNIPISNISLEDVLNDSQKLK